MAKNFSQDSMERRLENILKDLQKQVKELRSKQYGWQGYIVLPSASADPAGAADGAAYYNTSAHTVKVKLNGSWKTVTAT